MAVFGAKERKLFRPMAMAVMALGLFGPANAAVVPPGVSVSGHTQLDWSQQWWQWIVGIPTASNPLVDGDGSLALQNNNRDVFFLAGAPASPSPGSPISRTIDVPRGSPVFFPVLNNIDAEIAPFDACFGTGNPLGCALDFISPGISAATNLHATVDGVDVLTDVNKAPFRQTSSSFFDVTLPADNLLGLSAGSFPGSAVSDGFWVMRDGLPLGDHVVSFGGTFPDGTTVAVTDTLDVVPEPSGALILSCGLLALTGLVRRRNTSGRS